MKTRSKVAGIRKKERKRILVTSEKIKILIKRGKKEPLFSRVFFEAGIKRSEKPAW